LPEDKLPPGVLLTVPITPQQMQLAAARQDAAAHDPAGVVRTLAAPGTGKSRSIAERVRWLLQRSVAAPRIFVISFTRATVKDLRARILSHCAGAGSGAVANVVHVSTMHSLALSTLRRANLLTMFPSGPIILDEWEQENIFDIEYAVRFQTRPSRAAEIRLAYDAYWQTLQQSHLAPISQAEQANFVAFYSQFTTSYSCILPGEVVRRCVDAMRQGSLRPAPLLRVEHLIVDEFQDLNACDQEFVQGITAGGAILWAAGDDDQSIYSFRHADPTGIQNFPSTYPGSVSHTLGDCFRSTPSILVGASRLITYNPSPPRLQKTVVSLYANSNPPVQGRLHVWRLPTGALEAVALAESCRSLIAAGLHGEDVLILLSNRRAQLSLILQALDSVTVAYAAPRGPALGETDVGRLLLSILRIVQNRDDHVAHRDLLGLHDGVGPGTCIGIVEGCALANLNFRDVFYIVLPSGVFTTRCMAAIARVSQVCQALQGWALSDDIAMHDQEILRIIQHVFDPRRARCQQNLQEWQTLRGSLPGGMTLEELLAFLQADTEVAQLRILQEAQQPLAASSENVPVEHIDRLVQNYWDPNLQEDRAQLEADGVLLGPAVLEALDITERVKAFIAVWIQGPHPRNRDAFTGFLLRTDGISENLHTIYNCEGSYATVLEAVCSSLAELDHFTELIQTPPGGFRIETTTFVVAKVESELLPRWSSAIPDTAGAGEYSVQVRRIVESEIASRGLELATKFYELPIEEQLFLTQALTEIQTYELHGIDSEWADEIKTGIENFIRGVVRETPTDLKNSVACLARAVEGPCKRAVRLTVETFYGTNYGQAQKDLALQSSKFHRFTLGHCRNAFINMNRDERFQALGIVFDDDFVERLGWFENRRNELTHEPTPDKYVQDFQLFARDIRETWGHGLRLIDWLLAQVLERDYQTMSMSQAMKLLEVAREGQFLREIKDSVAVAKRDIIDHVARLSDEQRGRIEEVMASLTRLSLTTGVLPKEQDEWWQRFETLQRNEEEILDHVRPEARGRAREMIESIRKAGRDVAASAVGNLFFYVILNAPHPGLVTILERLLR
jgi:DNA helicase-2/ATP-dependent DNA helicase PcrA